MNRAYSLLEIKSFDDDERVIVGIATTPETDRTGDIVEPKGAQFTLPIPLLWQHDSRQPIGHVLSAKVTARGIEVKARFVTVDEPGALKDRLDEAWLSVKSGLVRGLSIGFKAIETAEIDGTYGLRFLKWLWLELSAVTIPANSQASIQTLKSLDAPYLAATGHTDEGRPHTPRARGTVRVIAAATRQDAHMKKTITEQIKDWENTRAAKAAERDAVLDTTAETGELPDETKSEEYDALDRELNSIDDHLKRLRAREDDNKEKAVAVAGETADEASRSRGKTSVITVTEPQLEKGIRFARYVMCKAAAAMEMKNGNFITPLQIAQLRHPSDTLLKAVFEKAAVAGSTTFTSNNLSDLVPYNVLESDFIEFLRGKTIVDQFGTNGIPSLRRVPFNIRVGGLSGGTTGYWKGEGLPVPYSKATSMNVTLTWATVAGLTAVTKELARFSQPSAVSVLRDDLADAVITRMDIDFVDPSKAAVANTSPASITNGIAATAPSGTAAVNVRKDAATLLATFATNNLGRSNLVWIMSDMMFGNIAMMVNALGQADFASLTATPPRLFGIPVITSEKLTSLGSPSTQMIILVKADEVYLADDGGVDVEVSDQASIEMLDSSLVQNGNTGTGTSLVSLWQSGYIGLLASRVITWKLRRSSAVQYISPAAYSPPSS